MYPSTPCIIWRRRPFYIMLPLKSGLLSLIFQGALGGARLPPALYVGICHTMLSCPTVGQSAHRYYSIYNQINDQTPYYGHRGFDIKHCFYVKYPRMGL